MRASSPDRSSMTAADMAACRSLLRDGSRTFLAASRLLPARVRDPATAFYAFCRLADDAVDLGGGSPDVLRERLERIVAGRPAPIAADRALSAVVARFAVPRALLDAMIEGFEWDAQGRRYETVADLYAYAMRVAGTVGAIMAIFMDRRDARIVGAACDLGMAMQFTNIARDVGEDARNGRLYLPRQWFADVGLDADGWLARPVHNEAIGRLVRRLLQHADHLYRRAEVGIAALPSDCRAGIYAARLLYAEIGAEVVRRGCDSVTTRARVSGSRKMALLVRATITPPMPVSVTSDPLSDEATRALVATVACTMSPPAAARARSRRLAEPGKAIPARFVWLIDLFARLERADRVKHVRRLGATR